MKKTFFACLLLGAGSFVAAGELGSTGLIVTEIMYNPGSPEDDWEWVEVKNTTSSNIDVVDHVIDDFNGSAHTAANITADASTTVIAPGAYAVLFNSDDTTAADFESAWGSGLQLIAVSNWAAMGLNNGGDTLGLWDSFTSYDGDNVTQANAFLSIAFDDSGDWPADNNASSIYLVDETSDATAGTSWAISAEGVDGAFTSSISGTTNTGADVGSPGTGTGAVADVTDWSLY